MKTPTSIKLSRFSAIRTKIMLPAIVVLAAMLNACSTKEEVTPTQEQESRNIAGRVNNTTGLQITTNGNNITITIGYESDYCTIADEYTECDGNRLYILMLGRLPNSTELTDILNRMNTEGYPAAQDGYLAAKDYLAYLPEYRTNIVRLYRRALQRGPGEITEAEIVGWQSSRSALSVVVNDFAISQEASDKGLNIEVVPNEL